MSKKARVRTTEEFVMRAKAVHGSKYDYSFSVFRDAKTPVKIVCPKHGMFEQLPFSHLKGHGCRQCGYESACSKADYKARQAAREVTLIERYGVDNPMKLDATKAKIRNTCLERYGVENPRQSNEVIDKARQTNLERYGEISYAKTVEGLSRIQATMKERYGDKNFMRSDAHLDVAADMREKARQTQLKRYGAEHYAQSDDFREHVAERKAKEMATKLERGTFNTSQPEEFVYETLCDRFGADDVMRQYVSDKYSFACDFYVVSRDLYIELNLHWTHGGHWFDGSNSDDMSRLTEWQSRGRDEEAYAVAAKVWSDSDMTKRATAKDNKLNYIVFWMANLWDFDLWLAMGAPDGCDWDTVYSYLPKRSLTELPVKNLSVGNLSALAKHYQMPVFYEKELALWDLNPYLTKSHCRIPLQAFLYINRYHYLKKLPEKLTDAELLMGFRISGLYRGFTSFDARLMQTVIERYDIKSVYDPCAGWGERMLCCALNSVRYFGVDVNRKLRQGYQNMMKDMCLIDQQIQFSSASLLKSFTEQFDAVITCPPYGNTEIYSNDGAENLSAKEFAGWWDAVVSTALGSSCKYFCIQTNQKYRDIFSEPLLKRGFKLIDELVFSKNPTSHMNRKNGQIVKREYESMLVFSAIADS